MRKVGGKSSSFCLFIYGTKKWHIGTHICNCYHIEYNSSHQNIWASSKSFAVTGSMVQNLNLLNLLYLDISTISTLFYRFSLFIGSSPNSLYLLYNSSDIFSSTFGLFIFPKVSNILFVFISILRRVQYLNFYLHKGGFSLINCEGLYPIVKPGFLSHNFPINGSFGSGVTLLR